MASCQGCKFVNFWLGTIIFWASAFVGIRHAVSEYHPLELALFPFGFSFFEKISSAGPEYTISVIYLGIFPAAIAYLCWAAVLSNMDASRASSFLYSVPVVVILMGWICLNELPSTISIIGGFIAITGVIYANLKNGIQVANIISHCVGWFKVRMNFFFYDPKE